MPVRRFPPISGNPPPRCIHPPCVLDSHAPENSAQRPPYWAWLWHKSLRRWKSGGCRLRSLPGKRTAGRPTPGCPTAPGPAFFFFPARGCVRKPNSLALQAGVRKRRRRLGRLFSFCGSGVCVRKPILLTLRAGVRKLRRRPGRLFSFSRPGVCVRKPNSLALRAGVRKLRRRPGRLFSFSRPGVCVRKPISLTLRAGVRKLRRRPGRLFSFCDPGVCVRKPILLALRAGVRKLCRRPGRFFSFCGPGVCVRKPILLTLQAGVRKLCRRTGSPLCSPCPQILMPSFRGAKSSHNCRPLNAFSPAHRPVSLLPLAHKSLCPRFGEQKPLQRFRSAAGFSLLYPYILYACISTYSS